MRLIMNWIKNKYFEFLLIFLIILIGIFHIGLPLYADFIVSFTLTFILRDWRKSLFTMISLIATFIAINFVYEQQINYRAHEMLYTSQGSYLPNKDIEFVQPYGDLFAIGMKDKALLEIVEPRKIRFVTDKNGFRNHTFKKNPDYILVGDSFVVGNGTTQEETLHEQMARKLDLEIYSLSFPGTAQDYERSLKNSPFNSNGENNVLLFYFEGNDFNKIVSKNNFYFIRSLKKLVGQLEYFKSSYLNKIYPLKFKFVRVINRKGRKSYTYLNTFIKSLLGENSVTTNDNVITANIGDSKVGFLKSYIDQSLAKSLDTYVWTDLELLKKVKYIIFIPTKYRVYHNLEENIPLKALIKGYESTSIPIIDMTIALQDAAKHHLDSNEFVYWRDDTHWNGLGISIAAELLGDLLKDNALTGKKSLVAVRAN